MSEITHEIALHSFYNQIDYALQNYKKHNKTASQFSNIIIAGLGGSGIGGHIAKTYFLDKASLPIEVYSDYQLPSYASKNSFIIICSYSGTTEETLSMYEQAKALNSYIVCISAGGQLLENAQKDNFFYCKIEQGYQPRMALGFSLTFNLLILSELFGLNIVEELKGLSGIYKQDNSALANNALDFFKASLQNKFTIIADNYTEAAGVRFCQQIQENAKHEAFINVLPEANHNVFETYYGQLPSNFIFINSHKNDRNDGRFAYLKSLLEKNNNKVFDLSIKDGSLYEIFKLINICDWFSINLSMLKNEDNMKVDNIMGLKDFLKTF